MPIVLVVDDSEVDRKLVAGLIKGDIDWIVEFASDGQQALDMMEYTSPNVVITDLMMPNMDGIELVKHAKKQYPQIPVILITGQGSESLASKALRAGATSYVPKSELADHLIDTVNQVLQLSEQDEAADRLMSCFTNSRYQFKLPNDPILIPLLVNFVQKLLTELRFGDAVQRRHVGIALEEALLNAIVYGNLELSKFHMQEVRRQMSSGTLPDDFETRRQSPPYDQRKVLFGMDVKPQRAEFIIRDSGSGFDTGEMPSQEELSTLASKDGGRGLTLIGNFMDAVSFNDSGNEIRMALLEGSKTATR